MALTRDEILQGAPEAPWVEMEIPEWGGTFLLKPLTGAQAEEVVLLNLQAQQTGKLLCLRGMPARVTAWAVCREDRSPLFAVSDASALTDKHLQVCLRVYQRVLQVNGLNDGEKAVEAAAKNSESIQS